MEDLVSDPDPKGETLNTPNERAHYQQPTVGPPRWVKAFGTAVIALVLIFVVLHLTGHGFGSHTALSISARQP